MPRPAFIACFAAFVGAAALPAAADPVSLATARGEVTVEASPKRVAVYDLAGLDMLGALGVAPAGAPTKVMLPYLKDDLAKATPVGTIFEPDLEALSALDPDLVVVGGRSAAKYDQMTKLAPTIDMTVGNDLLPEMRTRLIAYGRLFGKEDRAKELVAALDGRIKEVQGIGADKGKMLVLLVNGPKMAAYGKGSRFGWLHEVTGLAEAHPGLATALHGTAVSNEFLAQTNPDWIFVIDRSAAIGSDGVAARQTLDNPLVASTNAAKSGHILYLNAADAYLGSGGYQATMEILDELHKALGQS